MGAYDPKLDGVEGWLAWLVISSVILSVIAFVNWLGGDLYGLVEAALGLAIAAGILAKQRWSFQLYLGTSFATLLLFLLMLVAQPGAKGILWSDEYSYLGRSVGAELIAGVVWIAYMLMSTRVYSTLLASKAEKYRVLIGRPEEVSEAEIEAAVPKGGGGKGLPDLAAISGITFLWLVTMLWVLPTLVDLKFKFSPLEEKMVYVASETRKVANLPSLVDELTWWIGIEARGANLVYRYRLEKSLENLDLTSSEFEVEIAGIVGEKACEFWRSRVEADAAMKDHGVVYEYVDPDGSPMGTVYFREEQCVQ